MPKYNTMRQVFVYVNSKDNVYNKKNSMTNVMAVSPSAGVLVSSKSQ